MLDFPQPVNLTTLIYMAVASSLGWIGGWLKGRHRDRAEVRKIDAETQNIHTTAQVSSGGLTLEVFRQMQVMVEKAETRRDEYHQKEEQLRNQILFWRNRAEEMDGQLIDSRQANGLLQARLRNKSDSLDKTVAVLAFHKIPYADADNPEIKEMFEYLKARRDAELDRPESE